MRDVLQDLLQMLEDSVSQAGEVTTMIDKISKSITMVNIYYVCGVCKYVAKIYGYERCTARSVQ